ncbi:transcriptional regulator [Rhodoferax koreense]|uniref:Transcriptional regulator n=1 Tax=Rhodoferax koreensis TaxID=1842727 RepID=A0A1P8JU85_9BURK|nr:helix-turn-helix domain-containing protein [Rhodoferax koreense]APW37288.1 transcriptional regulator [Rhodoferax koreense]
MNPTATTTTCAECKLQAHCLPAGLDAGERDRIDSLMSKRIRVHRGDALYNNGDDFVSLYTVRTGFFKTSVSCDSGREQVTGFQMAGEILGLDGIHTGHHQSDAVALEDAEVCSIRFDRLETVSREIPAMQHHLHQLMSREIVRDHGMMLLLGGMRAEERLASFLLNLAARLRTRGFSACEFVLRMTREEIGSYLGLKLETISRAFSRLAALGIIEVQQKHVRILDIHQLEHVEQEEALAA